MANRFRFLMLLMVEALLATMFSIRIPTVYAASLTSISPNSMVTGSGITVLVAGVDFESGAVVVLNGYSALSTTFVNSGLLSATVPGSIPGSPTGIAYGVQVINPSAPTTPITNPAVTLVVFSNEPTPITPSPTPTITPTPLPTDFVRPILTVASYGASTPALEPATDIDFEMTLVNNGQLAATNIVLTFETGDLIPRATGGVRSLGSLQPGQTVRFFQPFTVSRGITPPVASQPVTVVYTDVYGKEYTETFDLTFAVRVYSGPGATATPTPTATPGLNPQLVIESYETDREQLQPGGNFTLTLNIRNVGQTEASNVTMVVGGSAEQVSNPGTPGAPGGVSGGGGEFTNFAPIGSSNVQVLGNLGASDAVQAVQPLVVNVSTNPGAYPLKISFVYTDGTGRRYVDDQVVTLLVVNVPQLEISFYRDPNPLFVGQPNVLPLQIINLGRRSAVLGNMTVSATGATLSNNTILVGPLDVGGFFTLDANLFPEQPGPLDLTITVNYSNDFNQPQTITQTLNVEVIDGGFIPPDGGGGIDGGGGLPLPEEPQPEPWWQQVWRFFLGLLGLDSGVSNGGGGGNGGVVEPLPGELPPPGFEVEPLP